MYSIEGFLWISDWLVMMCAYKRKQVERDMSHTFPIGLHNDMGM